MGDDCKEEYRYSPGDCMDYSASHAPSLDDLLALEKLTIERSVAGQPRLDKGIPSGPIYTSKEGRMKVRKFSRCIVQLLAIYIGLERPVICITIVLTGASPQTLNSTDRTQPQALVAS